jgi:hypothetical protein
MATLTLEEMMPETASLEFETAEKYYTAEEFRRAAKEDLNEIFKKYGRL